MREKRTYTVQRNWEVCKYKQDRKTQQCKDNLKKKQYSRNLRKHTGKVK